MKKTILAAALCASLLAPFANAQVEAKIRILANEQERSGKLRWMPSISQYSFTYKLQNNAAAEAEARYSPSDINILQVTPPETARTLFQQAEAKNEAAIPGLTKIMEDYKMLDWDTRAAERIAFIYNSKGRFADTVKLGDKLTTDNSSAPTTSTFAPRYWEALVATGKSGGGKLDGWLEEAIASAPRSVAASALIARGDMLEKEKNYKKALTDGYLRAALMFRNEKEPNAEALYKAALTFDKIGQIAYAEKMRQMLVDNHRTSPWTRKAQGGN